MGLSLNDYGHASMEGRVYMATAIVTAPVIFSTAAGTGGPLLWNPATTASAPNKTEIRLLRLGFAVTTASAVAGALGFTGGSGQAAAPTSTTAIDSGPTNLNLGSTNPTQVKAYRVGTVSTAGAWFLPVAQITTAAVTAVGDNMNWIDLQRMIVVPPGSWVSVSASATLTSAVLQIGLVWEEIQQP